MITSGAFSYINVLDKAADASWLREATITNNLANVDTPGFKRKDVDFEGVLKTELGRSTSFLGLRKEVLIKYCLLSLLLPESSSSLSHC